MKFSDIPQFPHAGYMVHISWDYLEQYINDKDRLNLCPDYQRGHVWTKAQQTAFVEYGLMGGEASMIITTNCPGWMGDFKGPYELVDGLQRITAVRRFMNNEIRVFGHLFREFTDRIRSTRARFEWRVHSLPTRRDVLKLYLLINSGGVVHSPKEIARVRALLEQEQQ